MSNSILRPSGSIDIHESFSPRNVHNVRVGCYNNISTTPLMALVIATTSACCDFNSN